ncbi:DNA polymerase eta [Striga asiatica]|uniref:DNA polymerase eta n=1 Tax=Striga asiatica TaxID=4170 RepID=A0A5A7Q6Y5_STRAF|nr:DNA polymerase eta [Striga asiatica]
MPVARPESSEARVIAHIDMDCFYVQVEQRKQPTLRGHPTAVVQYNSWKGGGLIAVGYEARKYGVKRSMRGHEAKKVCPDIQLVQVPVARGKADLSIYRNAGSEVVSILSCKGRCERASIDEVYLDLTEAAEALLAENPLERLDGISEEALKSHVLGLDLGGANPQECVSEWFLRSNASHRDKLLVCGALIVAELRLEVLKETEFTCSAGIAHNKPFVIRGLIRQHLASSIGVAKSQIQEKELIVWMLAKLASGMNKPAQQTIVPSSSVKKLLETLPVKKMKQLGGKLGTSLQTELSVNTVGDLLKFSEEKLQERYGVNTGTWLWNTARGICGEEVEGRLLPKSHGSGKTFPGPQALKTISCVQKWLYDLCEELNERLLNDLEQNKRIARTLTLHANAYKPSKALIFRFKEAESSLFYSFLPLFISSLCKELTNGLARIHFLNDSESLKKFPSKSCPLRYGITKIQEDALSLFHAGLREFAGVYNIRTKEGKQHDWAITGLSISASKIDVIPFYKFIPIFSKMLWQGTCSITKYFHRQHHNVSTSRNESDDTCAQDAASLSSSGKESCSGLCSADPHIDVFEDEIRDKHGMPSLYPNGHEMEVCEARTPAEVANNTNQTFQGGLIDETSSSYTGTEVGLGLKLLPPKMDAFGPSMKLGKQKGKPEREKGSSVVSYRVPYGTGNSTILRFFHSHEEHLHSKTFQESGASASGKLLQENQQPVTGNSGQYDPTSDAWSYKSDEIDPAVLNELPPEIQAEVCASLQTQKRAKTTKKGSSIVHYFSPTPNS